MENIEAMKLELMQLLLNTKKESILKKIKSIYQAEDWWEELSRKEQVDIEEGLTQAKNSQTASHQSVMKKFDQWK